MFAEDVVSDEVFESLLRLDQTATSDVAHRIALATMAGACRALCELYQNRMDEDGIREVVLGHLRKASPLCEAVFSTKH